MMLVPFHVTAGVIAIVAGFTALYAFKGGTLHRKSGTISACAMLVMSLSGAVMAVGRPGAAINIPAGLVTAYLVITSLATVRPAASRRVDVVAMLMGLVVGLVCIALALVAIGKGGREAGMAYPLVLFGAVAFLATGGDLRVIRAGGLRGTPRLARHLWRMCFALFIASIAFFLGPDRVPAMIRTPALRAAGVLLPIFAMGYWLWRVRARRAVRGVAGVGTTQATALAMRASQ
jgi:hypothetical protein